MKWPEVDHIREGMGVILRAFAVVALAMLAGNVAAQETSAPATAPQSRQAEAPDEISAGEWQEEYRQLNELMLRLDADVGQLRRDVQGQIERTLKAEQTRIQETYDRKYEQLDKDLQDRRDQAIAAFERFIQKYPSSSNTPLAMFRLAELYYDQASYAFIQAQKDYDLMLKGLDLLDTKTMPEDPRYDFARSLVLYDQIIRQFPDFKHIDAVYYMRAYLFGNDLAAQYQPEVAKDAWMDLISRRPDSVYASQAYLRIGEYYFDKSGRTELPIAAEYYSKVMSYQDKWYDRALYKMAWSYYKLSDYDQAISRFIDLIDFSQVQAKATGNESDLRAEAVEYLAISFADDGDVEKALLFFQKIGDRPYKFEVLKRLADIYYRQAKFEQAIETYRRLQVLFPDSPENPTFQHEIITIYQKMPIPSLGASIQAKEALILSYSPDSEWAKKQGLNRTAVSRAQELAQTMLQELAYYHHRQAEQAATPEARQAAYAVAAEKYREYLARFPYSKNAVDMQFYFAECLFISQRYEEAAAQYEKALTSTEPRYHADSARGAVDSYQELVKRKEGDLGVSRNFTPPGAEATPEGAEVPKPGTELIVYPLSALKLRFVQSIDVFARVAPTNPDVPNFLFIAAQISYYHLQLDAAEKRYREIIDLYPQHRVSIAAAANLVDCDIKRERWVDVQKSVDELVGLNLGSQPREWAQVRSQLVDVRVQAKQKEAEELAGKGNLDEAYRKFMDAGTDIGLLNAAKIMDSKGKVDAAVETYQQLVRQFPKSESVPFCLYRIASNYEKYFDLPKAIEFYERLASNYPKDERAPASINNAALLRLGLRQYKEAARAYERYSLAYPTQNDAELMLFLAGQNYQKPEDYSESVRAFRDYLKRFARVNGDRHMDAYLSVVIGLEKLGRDKEALEMEKKAPALMNSLRELDTFSPLGVNLYAQLMFREMERLMSTFQAVKLTGNMKALEAALDRKNQLKDQLEAKMKDMIRIGDLEWSTAALFQVGLAFHSFADALRDAVPPGLPPEDEELYRQTLEDEFIYPFEDRALEYYKRNLEIESTQRVWNRWIEQTYVMLNRLRPDLYPARKKENILFEPGEQRFSAPPIEKISGGLSQNFANESRFQ